MKNIKRTPNEMFFIQDVKKIEAHFLVHVWLGEVLMGNRTNVNREEKVYL